MTQRALGFLPLLVSVIYTILAMNIPLGSITQPGPGLYPVAIGYIAICLSLFVAISESNAKRKIQEYKKDQNSRNEWVQFDGESQVGEGSLLKIIACNLIVLSMIFLFNYLGALLSLFFLTLLLLKAFGTPGFIKPLIISICFALLIYLLFNNLLNLLLPKGLLHFLF